VRIRIVVVALWLLAAACPSSEPARPDPSPPAGPAPAGTIRFGYPAEPPTLDPIAQGGASAATRDLLRPILPSLFALDSGLRPVGDLAESWAVSEDAVRITLRDAAWSDGTPVSASDVRFSWEHLRDGPTGLRYRPLRDVDVIGPKEFRLVFDEPVRRWWSLFSIDDFVLPAHAYDTDWRNGPTVGAGPFVFDGWTRGLSVRLVRNDAYSGEPAGAEAIEVLFVPDDETRLQLLERGELDVVYAAGEANFGARAQARGFEPTTGEADGGPALSGSWGPTWWELDLNAAKLGDAAGSVARAVATGLDRTLVAELLEDSGQVMHGIPAAFPVPGPRAAGEPPVDGPWSRYTPDLDAAREALGGSRTITLTYARGSSAASGIARMIHFRLLDAGLRVDLAGVDADRFDTPMVAEGSADAYLVLRRGADAPDVWPYHANAVAAGRVPTAGRAIEDAVTGGVLPSQPTPGLDAGDWTQAESALAASGLVIPLARVRTWLAVRDGIAGPHALGTASGPLWNASAWRGG